MPPPRFDPNRDQDKQPEVRVNTAAESASIESPRPIKKKKERESSRTLRPPVATERNILMFKRPLKELPRWRIKIKSRLVLKLIYNPPFAEKASWKYMRRWPRRFGGWFHLEPYFLSTASQDIIQNIWQDNKAACLKATAGAGMMWCGRKREKCSVFFGFSRHRDSKLDPCCSFPRNLTDLTKKKIHIPCESEHQDFSRWSQCPTLEQHRLGTFQTTGAVMIVFSLSLFEKKS